MVLYFGYNRFSQAYLPVVFALSLVLVIGVDTFFGMLKRTTLFS